MLLSPWCVAYVNVNIHKPYLNVFIHSVLKCYFSLSWDPRPNSGPQFQGSMTSMETNISSAPVHLWTSMSLHMRKGLLRDLITQWNATSSKWTIPIIYDHLFFPVITVSSVRSWCLRFPNAYNAQIAGLSSVTLLKQSKSDSDTVINLYRGSFFVLFIFLFTV